MIEILAYAGTVLLFSSSILKRRLHMHLGRCAGNGLWLIYAFYIGNLPLIITDALAILFDVYAAWEYRKQ